jgi:hypothetical protein
VVAEEGAILADVGLDLVGDLVERDAQALPVRVVAVDGVGGGLGGVLAR